MGGVIYHVERRRLSDALNSHAPVFWRPHALLRAKQRRISKVDAERVIRRSAIVSVDFDMGEERWRLSGKDPDGKKLDVVVALETHEGLLVAVVTVID